MEFEAIETIVQPKKVASGQLHASLKVYKNASNKLLMDGIRMKTCMSVEWWYSLEKKKVMLDEKKNVRRVNQCCILVKCVAILSIAKFYWKTSIPLFISFHSCARLLGVRFSSWWMSHFCYWCLVSPSHKLWQLHTQTTNYEWHCNFTSFANKTHFYGKASIPPNAHWLFVGMQMNLCWHF